MKSSSIFIPNRSSHDLKHGNSPRDLRLRLITGRKSDSELRIIQVGLSPTLENKSLWCNQPDILSLLPIWINSSGYCPLSKPSQILLIWWYHSLQELWALALPISYTSTIWVAVLCGLMKAGLAHICKLKNYSDFVFIYSKVRAIGTKTKNSAKILDETTHPPLIAFKKFQPNVCVCVAKVCWIRIITGSTNYFLWRYFYIHKFELLGKKPTATPVSQMWFRRVRF